MRRITRQTLVFCLAAALVILPIASTYAAATTDTATTTEQATSPSLGSVAADLVAVRPLGIASTALGLVGYVISLPFSIPGGNSGKVWEKIVVDPAGYTFKRPIGEF